MPPSNHYLNAEDGERCVTCLSINTQFIPTTTVPRRHQRSGYGQGTLWEELSRISAVLSSQLATVTGSTLRALAHRGTGGVHSPSVYIGAAKMFKQYYE